MGFGWKDLGRAAVGVATGGISEFTRDDPFGVPGAGQYMPMVAGAGLGAMFGNPMLGAQMGAGIFSARDQARQQAQANAMNVALSREQMAFQERMSSTAHQREVADLRKAGLNPMLSVNAGASSPSGSMAEVDPLPSIAERSLSSAFESTRLNAELRTAKALAQKAEAEGGLHQLEFKYAKENPNTYFSSKFGMSDWVRRLIQFFGEDRSGRGKEKSKPSKKGSGRFKQESVDRVIGHLKGSAKSVWEAIKP